ncbi:uncharacterized protein [Drosophila tropicalis]|uniref:uncharacterized protein isoform X2 n=1 Tax=Drosophila tropicalis TaxID=46794 RepID=UPI0035ABFA74
MWAVQYVLCALTCITFMRGTHGLHEDCEVAPPVEHATSEILISDSINTAIYSCEAGYLLKGKNELTCYVKSDQWQGEPPKCEKETNLSERRKKILALAEEPKVNLPLASQLDLSCSQGKAPQIRHGTVVSYERRRRGEKVFLVAYYGCNENYEFESTDATAMYCRQKEWVGEIPTCIPLAEYSDDEDADDQYEEYETIDKDQATVNSNHEQNSDTDSDDVYEDEDEEEALGNEIASHKPPPPAPPSPPTEVVIPERQIEDFEHFHPEPEIVVKVAEPEPQPELEVVSQPEPQGETEQANRPEASEAEPQDNTQTQPDSELKPEDAATDITIVIEPTSDPYTPRLLDADCGKDQGGCAHKCERLLFPGENEPRLKCSCFEGYALNTQDYATCHDVDECQESNGGCSQICNNLPGSYQCACQEGYQIDVATGKTCVDIDECILPEVIAECSSGCENTPGSYRCILPLIGKEEAREEEPVPPVAVDAEVTSEATTTPAAPAATCNAGFILSPSGNECLDINECEIIAEVDEVDAARSLCQQKCENTIGSYRCLCHDGYHLDEDKKSCIRDSCEDLDNPQLNRTRCAHQCVNLANEQGYECICPKGYNLAEDHYSCEVAESACTTEQGYERCRPGSCIPSEDNSSFICECPPGYVNEGNGCKDIDECLEGTHLCSHSCFNTEGAYQCLCPGGMTLVEEFTCVGEDPCAGNNNGCEQICLTARGGSCSCREGFRLSEDGKSCNDVDECAEGNGGCQQVCQNLPGSHQCACDQGFELSKDKLTCVDIDECSGLLSGGCTHECINKEGSFECGCPLGYILQSDGRSCRPALVGCPPGSRQRETPEGGCEPITCELGFILGAVGKCVDIDECQLNRGGCSHDCQNIQGSFKCFCPEGYQLDETQRRCQDIDECQENNGGCLTGICVNELGGFLCEDSTTTTSTTTTRSPPVVLRLPKLPELPTRPTLHDVAKPHVDSKLPQYPARRPNLNGQPLKPRLPELPRLPKLPEVNRNPVSSFPRPSLEVRDQCVRFQAPANGRAHCNKYRHKKKYFYTTRCKVICNSGYRLQGSEIRTCGASGKWDGQDNKCIAIKQQSTPSIGKSFGPCPPLQPAQNGLISPPSCTQRHSNFGDFCHLKCRKGFHAVGPSFITCMPMGWTFNNQLQCQPSLGNNLLPLLPSGRVQLPGPRRVKPFIRCPQNVVILLKPGQTKAHVILQAPQTNLDQRHITAQPPWAAQLQSHLPAGIHKVIFRAQNPSTKQAVGCQTVITIKNPIIAASPPPVSEKFSFNFNPAARTTPIFQTSISGQHQRPASLFRSSSVPKIREPAPFPLFNFDTLSSPKTIPAFNQRSSAKLIDASSSSLSSSSPSPFSLVGDAVAPSDVTVSSSDNSRLDLELGSAKANYCPPSIEVYLKENQNLRSVVWDEPRFEGKLLKIFKSHFPGALFRLGEHTIKYEATTTDGLTLSCSFRIHIKAAKPTPAPSQPDINLPQLESLSSLAPAELREAPSSSSSTSDQLFSGYDSYVVCPDKEPIRVTSQQSVDLPVGCTLKNIRPQTSPQQTQHPKRGLLTSLWRSYARF